MMMAALAALRSMSAATSIERHSAPCPSMHVVRVEQGAYRRCSKSREAPKRLTESPSNTKCCTLAHQRTHAHAQRALNRYKRRCGKDTTRRMRHACRRTRNGSNEAPSSKVVGVGRFEMHVDAAGAQLNPTKIATRTSHIAAARRKAASGCEQTRDRRMCQRPISSQLYQAALNGG